MGAGRAEVFAKKKRVDVKVKNQSQPKVDKKKVVNQVSVPKQRKVDKK